MLIVGGSLFAGVSRPAVWHIGAIGGRPPHLIAKLKHDRFGASSERGRKLLDQLELQLEELEATAAEDEAALEPGKVGLPSRPVIRRKPVRGPLPAHLPRERVVVPGPTECPCCKGRLAKLGEDVTETLEVIPRQWKVIQTVRERFTCRAWRASPSRPRRSTRLPAVVPGPSCWP